METKGYN